MSSRPRVRRNRCRQSYAKSASGMHPRGASSRRRGRRRNAVARPGAPIIFFFFHRRYCTSIFIPPHVPARRPARGGREKMQPPNTIDRYKHTRATITDVCYSAYNVSRASARLAEGDRKRSTHRCPLSFYREIRWNRKREIAMDHRKEEQGERYRERTECVTRAQQRSATRSLYRQHRCRWDVAPADYVVSESCFNAKCICPNASTTSVPIPKPSHHRPRGLVRGRPPVPFLFHPLFHPCALLPSLACIGYICSRFSLAALGPKRADLASRIVGAEPHVRPRR